MDDAMRTKSRELHAKIVGLEIGLAIYERAASLASDGTSESALAACYQFCCLRDAAREELLIHKKQYSELNATNISD